MEQKGVVLKIVFISDRQDLIESMKIRSLGLESLYSDRIDMFWIKGSVDDKDVCFIVEPDLSNISTFSLFENGYHSYHDNGELKTFVSNFPFQPL